MIRNLRPKKGKREPRPGRQAGRGWLNGGGPDPWDGGDRTSTRTMAANQLRLWFASMAYVLVEAIRRLALQATDLADATCGTIRRKLFKVGALVTISVRRIKFAMASGCPYKAILATALRALRADLNTA
jgi:hypothetical protein